VSSRSDYAGASNRCEGGWGASNSRCCSWPFWNETASYSCAWTTDWRTVSGQRHFDFDEVSEPPEVSLPQPPATAEQAFERGCREEECGRLDEAAEAYRKALLLGGPDPTICFNLANVLNAVGRKEQAVERYYQVVELDRADVAAWNNLGVVLADLGRTREAIAALEQVLAIDRDYADARYNLADLLDEAGRETEAAAHWRAYAAKDRCGAWAMHARERLNASGCGKREW
jgi:tetratricopeptide (TPR) repeat protein